MKSVIAAGWRTIDFQRGLDRALTEVLRPTDLRFFQSVRAHEKRAFPEFRERNCIAEGDCDYLYFAPSWHFGKSLLTEETVQDIKQNKKQLLSVGSGRAYLERTLVGAFGIDRKQITLSDLNPIMPRGFRSFTFDMRGAWPDFGNRFDFVIFPESLLAIINTNSAEEHERLKALIEKTFRVVKPGGEIRMSGHNIPEQHIEQLEAWLADRHHGTELEYNRFLMVIRKPANE